VRKNREKTRDDGRSRSRGAGARESLAAGPPHRGGEWQKKHEPVARVGRARHEVGKREDRKNDRGEEKKRRDRERSLARRPPAHEPAHLPEAVNEERCQGYYPKGRRDELERRSAGQIQEPRARTGENRRTPRERRPVTRDAGAPEGREPEHQVVIELR